MSLFSERLRREHGAANTLRLAQNMELVDVSS
jgi:hypothetical protein